VPDGVAGVQKRGNFSYSSVLIFHFSRGFRSLDNLARKSLVLKDKSTWRAIWHEFFF